MSKADQIRDYVFHNYVLTARKYGWNQVCVVTGDVHKAMKLEDWMPLVCSSLEAKKFQQSSGIKLIQRSGPKQGATVRLIFSV